MNHTIEASTLRGVYVRQFSSQSSGNGKGKRLDMETEIDADGGVVFTWIVTYVDLKTTDHEWHKETRYGSLQAAVRAYNEVVL